MRFQGGGIGHRATCEWDEFLQHNPGKVVKDESDDKMDESQNKDGSDSEIAEEELEGWEAVMEREDGDDSGDGDGDLNGGGGNIGSSDSESDSGSEDNEDRVVAAEKSLMMHIYAREGYGAL